MFGDRAVIADAGTDTIGVVALVGNDDGTMLDAFEQRLGMRHVVIVAGRDQELDRAALRIDARVDFRREAAAASPHTTISTFFLLRRHADARARSSSSIICTLPSCAFTMASIRRSQIPCLAPAVEAIVGRRVGPVSLGHVAPRRTCAQYPEDAVEHAPVFLRLDAAPLPRQQRLDDAPLEVREIVAHDPGPDVWEREITVRSPVSRKN